MSHALDHFYSSRDAGIHLQKPKLKIGPYYESLINVMDKRRFPGWLSITTDLLRSASFDDQKMIDRHLGKLKANVLRNWRDPEHDCSIILTPPETRDTVIVFHVYPPELADKRKDAVRELINKALDIGKRDRCVVICRNTAMWADPYSFVVVARAANDAASERDIFAGSPSF